MNLLIRSAPWLLALLLIAAHAHAHKPTGADWQRLAADEPAPAFALTDQNGKPVRLADLRGQTLILTFMYTQCTDVCPVLPQMLARVDQRFSAAERGKFRFIGISVDPRRDTPPQMRKFMQERGLAEARWTLLTGSVKALTQVATDYGVVVRPDPRGELVHNTVFVLIDEKGQERVEFHGLATPTDEIANALHDLLATPIAQKR